MLYLPVVVLMSERVTIKVPATTANLGPGFDCIGMALDIWNSIDVQVGQSAFEIVGEGEEGLPRGPENLVARAFRAAFEEAGLPVPEARIVCRNEIPLDRGLGSSSAAVVGGLVAGNELAGRPLDSARLLRAGRVVRGPPGQRGRGPPRRVQDRREGGGRPHRRARPRA